MDQQNSFELSPRPTKPGDEPTGMSGNLSSTASNASAATPSSVLVGSPLARELSDLSGSYLNGSPLPKKLPAASPSRANVPQNIYPSDDATTIVSYERAWRQAYTLSQPAPPESELSPTSVTKKAVIMVERNEDVEVIKRNDAEAEGECHRLPLVLLLMDPGKKLYEMLQLWVDAASDTVRDVLHALQGRLTDKWKQDYDGLFQIRWQKSSQLIHILSISKYDVVPYEVWIAKPWSMSANTTISYAEGLLTHLKAIGMIQFSADSMPSMGSPQNPPLQRPLPPRVKVDPPTVLTLTEAAQARIYAPDGILKHHHASEFLTFSPPFESPTQRGVEHPDELSASQMTESNCESTANLNISILESLSTDVINESDCKEIIFSKRLTVVRDSSGVSNQRSDEEDGLIFRAHDADSAIGDGYPANAKDKSYYTRSRRRSNPFKCLLACGSRRRNSSETSLHGPWEKLDEEGQPLPLDSSETLLETYSADDNRAWETERGTIPCEDPSVMSETAPLLLHGSRNRRSLEKSFI